MSIKSICNTIKYVRSYLLRLEKFKECVKYERIETNGLIFLDAQTRWSSTYFMLKSTFKFQKIFEQLYVYSDEFLDILMTTLYSYLC